MLGLDEIDIYESFYDMGGDSILATHLAQELEKEFSGMIGVSDIFTYTSVHELAEYIDMKLSEENKEKLKVDDLNSEEEIEEIFKKLSNGEISVTEVDELIK